MYACMSCMLLFLFLFFLCVCVFYFCCCFSALQTSYPTPEQLRDEASRIRFEKEERENPTQCCAVQTQDLGQTETRLRYAPIVNRSFSFDSSIIFHDRANFFVKNLVEGVRAM